jgi:hypothetical protein
VNQWKALIELSNNWGPLLINVTEMMFLRFENGKVVEAWEDYDEQGMLQQLTTD